jgi:AcrR family transcriptional regulator
MKRKHSQHATTAKRRQQILQAALACFIKTGVTDTGVADICKLAGASIGSVYHHFKSKEQLAASVYIEGIRNYQNGYLAELENCDNARDGITAVVHYHLWWVIDNPDWSRYLFKERHAAFMGKAEEEFKRLNHTFLRQASSWFQEHINAGKLKKLPPDIFISVLMGPCLEFARHYLFGQARTNPKEAAQKISQAIWQALKNS